MSHFQDSILELQKRTQSVSEAIGDWDWSGLESVYFVTVATDTARNLSGVADALSDCEHFAELAASDTAAEFRDKKLACLDLRERLEKNADLESGKSDSKVSGVAFPEKNRFNAHFSGLHHEVRTLLLQVSYLSEKAALDSRRLESSPLTSPSSAKTLLSLLREKESELQGALGSQVEWQKKALLGSGNSESLSDIEHEAMEAHSRLKVIQHRLDAA
ncbi:MAG: hypothetical protein Q7R47_00535, partial [Candidatus Diapherotrites archaeon]|nr:hypothetical protein [Candidatus Diapherotrites archaeon]